MSLKPCSIGVPGGAEAFVAQSVGVRKMTAMKESRPCLVFIVVISIILSIGRRGRAQEDILPCDCWHALAVKYLSRPHDTAFSGKTMSCRGQRFVISPSPNQQSLEERRAHTKAPERRRLRSDRQGPAEERQRDASLRPRWPGAYREIRPRRKLNHS